jgi:tetratricopeptide (TPR) repeat protein
MSQRAGRGNPILPAADMIKRKAVKARLLRLAVGILVIVPAALSEEDLFRIYSEAQLAQATGDLRTATSKYEAIVRMRPQMAEAHANLGNLYYQQGQTERAKAAYQKAIRIKPDLAGPYFFLGVITFGEHDYAGALRHLQRAQALETSNVLIHSYLGYTHYARSSFRDAAVELEKAMALDGADIDLLYHLSKSYDHLARDSYTDLQTVFSDSVYAILARAHVYETREDWKAASGEYKAALDKMPENKRLREKLQWTEARDSGSPASNSGRADELIDASLIYHDSPPSGPALKNEMARLQSKVRDLAQASKNGKNLYLISEGYRALSIIASLAVFEVDPDSYRVHQLRAQLLEESRNDQGAIEEYRNVLKRKPDLPNIHFAIGSLYWKEQRFEEARPALEAELQINPNHPQAQYELGDLFFVTGETQIAEKYFLQAIKLEPSMVEAHFALEKIYTQTGRFEKSLEHLQKALQAGASEPMAHYRLAQVYRKLGRNQDADRELAIFNQKRARANSAP